MLEEIEANVVEKRKRKEIKFFYENLIFKKCIVHAQRSLSGHVKGTPQFFLTLYKYKINILLGQDTFK